MVPDDERIKSDKSMPSSSTTFYPLTATTKAVKPTSKINEARKTRQSKSTMAYTDEGSLMKKSSLSPSIKKYSLVIAKAVKYIGKTVEQKQSQLQRKQRQRQQQRLQHIRAIRRKRTVAFAVNHEKVSQPHTACVVSSVADSAPKCYNSSSAQSNPTRDIVSIDETITLRNSTVNRNGMDSRASHTIRDSRRTFQQNASDSVEDYYVKDFDGERKQLTESMTDPPNHQISNAEDETDNIIYRRPINNENDHDTKQKKQKRNNKLCSRLVVNVRCAEEAAAEISKNVTLTSGNGHDGCHTAPVPVTPTYLVPFTNESNSITSNTKAKGQRIRRPWKKIGPCPKQEQDATSCIRTSSASSKHSCKLEIKRVRYDMEGIPSVKVAEKFRGDCSSRYRNQFESRKLTCQNQSECDDDTNGNHTIYNERYASKVLEAVTIASKVENNKIAQVPLLQGSILWIPSSRQEWEDCVSEMKAVCTSAAFRRWSKGIINEYENYTNSHAKTVSIALSSSSHSSTTMASFQPPLSQAFIKDRIQIDDPLKGYQIRHAKGGWLQGFLVWTNFTVWTQDFQWDSNHPSSGLHDHSEGSTTRSVADDDGTLSKELQMLSRGEQDPVDGGIVLERVAEISLLGGLGCGELLLRKAIEDIRNSKRNGKCKYKYVVLQSTEGSRRFYEKMGFVRVGAVCRYRWAEYCTNKTVSPTDMTKTRPDLEKVEIPDGDLTFEPPPTFHGYRHWTYTNESHKSLDAHGGPSLMMCLKLEKINEENDEHGCKQTVSELLQHHFVPEKPTIHLFGNVSNPDSDNIAPTRKSQRRSFSNGTLRGMQQRQQQENEVVSHRQTVVGVAGSGGLPVTTAIVRRTSNRSKRGRNESLANSGYVFYGVERGQNANDENVINVKTYRKEGAKRQRLSLNLVQSSSLQEVKASKEAVNERFVIPSGTNKKEIGSWNRYDGATTIITQDEEQTVTIGHTSCVANINESISVRKSVSNSIVEQSFTEVLQPLLQKNCNPDKTSTFSTKKNVENSNITDVPHLDHQSSTMSKTSPSSYISPVLSKATKKLETKPVDNIIAGTEKAPVELERNRGCSYGNVARITIGTSDQGSAPGKVFKAELQTEDSSPNSRGIDLLLSKESGKISFSNIDGSVEAMSAFKLSPTSRRDQKSTKITKQRSLVHDHGTRRSHQTTMIPRKRLRQPPMVINPSVLFKQRVSRKANSNAKYFNQIIVRRNIESILDRGYCSHIIKQKPDKNHSKRGQRRWRYNGGLMIDHRFEFCFYYVLYYKESQKSLTIVPMIKDGVFERPTGSTNSCAFDERLLGRPRYQCNILDTDKNWIRDVPLEDYAIVPEAVVAFDTPFVVEEAWDIGGDDFVPYV